MKCFHWFEHIRPGGGPSGYGFNLYKAVGRCDSNIEVIYGSKGEERVGASKSKQRALLDKFPIVHYFLILLRLIFPKKKKKYLEREYHNSTIIVHDIFNASSLAIYGANNIRKLAMIHSPKSPSSELLDNLGLKPDGFLKLLGDYVEIYIFNKLDGVVCPSDTAYEAYYTGGNKERFELIKKVIVPSAVNCLNVSYEHEIDKSDLTIGYLGRYNKDKGFDCFLNLIPLNKDLKFISAGSGAINPLPYENYINLGWISNPLDDFFCNISILIVPNNIAYFDLVILEALSIGVPVITTNVGGSKSLQRPGVYLVENEMLLQNDYISNLASEIAIKYDFNKVKEQFIENYSLDKLVRRYENI